MTQEFIKIDQLDRLTMASALIEMQNAVEPYVKRLIELGHSREEAASMIAHVLLRESWRMAAQSILDKGERSPEPQNFLDAAQNAIDSTPLKASVKIWKSQG